MNIAFRPNPPIDAAAHHRAGAEEPRASSWPATTSCASSARSPTPTDRAQFLRDVLRSLGPRRRPPERADDAMIRPPNTPPASSSAASRRRCAWPTTS
ncbi:MAG: hypothetical protein MZW92_70125 [Comamonadaceae bacterium]|nr:hypothetical protein [Comamonadaceae bacterium]